MNKLLFFYFLSLWLNIQSYITTAFILSTTSTTSFLRSSSTKNDDLVVVVGKIIIDDYRTPATSSSSNADNNNDDDDDDRRRAKSKITIGGGGPQAAWGAAAALAVIQTFSNNNNDHSTFLLDNERNNQDQSTTSSVPPKQNVAFLGPIGKFSKEEYKSLQETLEPAIEIIKLIQDDDDNDTSSSSLETPRIQLWHNTKQEVQWKPIGDTWGANGADTLWKNRPSANDILQLLNNNNKKSISNLHVIIEVGANSPGNGYDSLLLTDDRLIDHVNYIGIEPIAFPIENEKGESVISAQDSMSAKERLCKIINNINMIVPDSHLAEALVS